MKSLPVGEFKAHFSEVLEKVQQGESFGILYGKSKKLVAEINPPKLIEMAISKIAKEPTSVGCHHTKLEGIYKLSLIQGLSWRALGAGNDDGRGR